MHLPTPAEHAQHDLDLIAAHLAGDLTGTERIRADSLLQSCTSCADLRRDLVAIATATRALPRAVRVPRDFRIDAAQAERLRGGGWLRSLLRPFRAPESAFRPMGAALTTLGLAGLLVANVLPSLFGSAGSAAPLRDQSQAAGATAAAAPAGSEPPALRPVSGGGAGGPVATGDVQFGNLDAPTPVADTTQVKSNAGHTAAPVAEAPAPAQTSSAMERLSANANAGTVGEPAPINPLIVGSLALLGVGLALFGLRVAARRFG